MKEQSLSTFFYVVEVPQEGKHSGTNIAVDYVVLVPVIYPLALVVLLNLISCIYDVPLMSYFA